MRDTSSLTPAPSSQRYSTVAIALHWTLALAVLLQLVVGLRMGATTKSSAAYGLYQLHKSVGVSILLLTLVRIGWRLSHKPPELPAHLKTWEKALAKAAHILFYLILLGLPLTGWIMVSASKTNIPTLLFGVVPWPHLPMLPELAEPAKAIWRKGGELGHGVLVKLTYLLLLVHVGGALKHQWVDRDATLSRMIPGVKPGALFDPRALLAATGVAGALAFGVLVFPDGPNPTPPKAPATAKAQAPITEELKTPAPALTAPAAVETRPAATAGLGSEAGGKPPVTALVTPPVSWVVQPGSTLGFQSAWSGDPVIGHFTRWTAKINFSPTALSSSHIEADIDPASAATGDAQRDATLPTADWFSTAKFPTAHFSARSLRTTPEGFIAEGPLTLKGVSHTIALAFTLQINHDQAVADGETRLDRTLFGVGQGDYAGTDQIPAMVALKFHIIARRAAP